MVATDYSVTSMMHDDLNSSAMRVKSGYAGHVPRAKDKYGGSAVGKTRTIEGKQKGPASNSGVQVEGRHTPSSPSGTSAFRTRACGHQEGVGCRTHRRALQFRPPPGHTVRRGAEGAE